MRTLTFFTKLVLFLCVVNLHAQKTSKKDTAKDTVVYKTGYGLRLGIDLSKPGLSFIDKSYTGFEIVGDYRVSKNWYVAAEIGHEEEITFEDFTTSTSKGNYIRLGGNLNTYTNWLDMNNEVYVGGRYGFAIFEHTLNEFTPNTSTGNTATPDFFPIQTITTPVSESGLTAHWIEFQLGIKVETFKNLFIGFHGSYKIGLSIDDQDNFKTLYAPGFNRVFESNTGFGFNYTISYLIPFVNK
ncbi:DUF6048 family protein [uncultured Tenacibaculum sp.]|uniref:DUF6048 family protein n=1 Tax=uncultured Tenacibaculum sp. TaxID=174713 RepID=UPI0026262E1A|nr:DUF6048 family protein [uncultured Tenacibaculum sp.]